MATLAQSTVKTAVYIENPLVSPHTMIAVPALKGFSPAGGGKRKKVDKSNFDSVGYNENQGGRADPAEASGEIILMKSLVGHQNLKKIFEAQAQGTTGNVNVFVGDSDGAGAPTFVATVFTPPQTASPKKWARSGESFQGYISNLSPKYQDDDIIRADFAIQISGATTWYNKGDAIALTY